MSRLFYQVDVFTEIPYQGNPVAVVCDAAGLTDSQLAAFARWTNLSETTFLLPPTDPAADYRLRIFTPGGELPFAGHPTLGSCHAWLSAGGSPRHTDYIIQECDAGLVRIKHDVGRLAFAAPELRRSGALDAQTLHRAVHSLGITEGQVRGHQWVDNGPGWLGLLLDSAQAVLDLRPDFAAMHGLKVGVIGPGPAGADADFEVRAFVPDLGVNEDPVTGSLNAGLAQWLTAAGIAPPSYTVRQGSAMHRNGRIHIDRLGEDIWVGGSIVTCISGEVRI